MTINMVYVKISEFFDERQPRYNHSKNDLKYPSIGAILSLFLGGAPAAPREGLGSNSLWLWTYPMGTWSTMVPKQSYQIWPFPAMVWGSHKRTLKVSSLFLNSRDYDNSDSFQLSIWHRESFWMGASLWVTCASSRLF